MEQRIRFQLIIDCDTEIEAPNVQAAWDAITRDMQEIVNREYRDQRKALASAPDNLFFGLTLRLPGDIIVTGLDIVQGSSDGQPFADSDLSVQATGRGPKLRLITGGAS